MIEYVNAANSPFSLNLTNAFTGQMNLQEVRMLADTTDEAISILLPAISGFPAQNVKIYVTDYLGNAATNNITVYASGGNTINGASSAVISTDNGFLKLEIGAASEWISVSASSGGGGGTDVTVKDFDVTIPAARVQEMLNDTSEFEIAIPSPASDEIIEIITSNMGVGISGGGNVPYNGTAPKMILCSDITDIKTLIFTTKGQDIDPDFSAVPPNFYFVMTRKFSDVTYAGQSALNYGGNGVYIRSYDNYVVTQGNTDLRFFGTYRIKKMS